MSSQFSRERHSTTRYEHKRPVMIATCAYDHPPSQRAKNEKAKKERGAKVFRRPGQLGHEFPWLTKARNSRTSAAVAWLSGLGFIGWYKSAVVTNDCSSANSGIRGDGLIFSFHFASHVKLHSYYFTGPSSEYKLASNRRINLNKLLLASEFNIKMNI